MENFLPVVSSVVVILSILVVLFARLCLNLFRRAEIEMETMIAGIFNDANLELEVKLKRLKSEIKAVNDEASASYRSGL